MLKPIATNKYKCVIISQNVHTQNMLILLCFLKKKKTNSKTKINCSIFTLFVEIFLPHKNCIFPSKWRFRKVVLYFFFPFSSIAQPCIMHNISKLSKIFIKVKTKTKIVIFFFSIIFSYKFKPETELNNQRMDGWLKWL